MGGARKQYPSLLTSDGTADPPSCMVRGTLLRCGWSIHVRVAVAAFKGTNTAGEKWISYLGSDATNEC
ncbi:hypothetical protein Y032_0065g3676 [Ancylostoma ceylanicum]|uniref:Uncharacterized protein n=1 Tax=Ancylostoma ceylanicum TaxID=53326 RepID=A0A016U246_9BILA|nr:hypothetical protein Y032_0065g3676 [Ancylostoma ceylanicum]